MKKIMQCACVLFAITGGAQAALYINAGGSPTAGEGPTGADANYLTYQTAHENDSSGALQTYTGTSFAEGGLGGTYNVGVAFSWPDATGVNSNNTKQAFGRTNDQGYPDFYADWVGIDIRATSGGTGGNDSFVLSLTGLEANQAFVLTSYHFDSQNQAGTFTVDQTPTASETATSPFDFPKSDGVDPDGVAEQTPWIDNAYSFDVTSDGSGNLDITYTRISGSWIGINGFDLVAVPEPATLGLVAAFGGGVLFIRRRFMM
ncbi:PEP-CTERM sorting domain-containing protein [Pontiellaceae bacterium B12227]|nr:PEP-CTERM sorting domain-containing protein [Pontiellaceae bacterium B12227]